MIILNSKIKYLDLFAGCGGLTDGLLQTGDYEEVAAVEWLKPQVETLRKRLKDKWNYENSDETVMHFDIQRENELFYGWKDEKFGSSKGLDFYVNNRNGIDVVVGGPPCQAYSVAGRVRDQNGMRDDYRNFLFEHYLSIVNRYQPKVFVFENVPGILSAKPGDKLVTDLITESFESIGYEIISDLKKYAQINAKDYGVPQSRKRIIIVGVKKNSMKSNIQDILKEFYTEILPSFKIKKELTVFESIGDLPKFIPIFEENAHKKRDVYRSLEKNEAIISWHNPRYHNVRDMNIFRMLAKDIEEGSGKYTNSTAISKLYEEQVGSKSPIHRYHVLKPEKPSTTIIAHLHKDGNRFIHYDSFQSRTITPREAARLQSFDDDFDFIGTQGATYQMIGNAVPPVLAKAIGKALKILIEKY